jgi:hypothetical protein
LDISRLISLLIDNKLEIIQISLDP